MPWLRVDVWTRGSNKRKKIERLVSGVIKGWSATLSMVWGEAMLLTADEFDVRISKYFKRQDAMPSLSFVQMKRKQKETTPYIVHHPSLTLRALTRRRKMGVGVPASQLAGTHPRIPCLHCTYVFSRIGYRPACTHAHVRPLHKRPRRAGYKIQNN